MKAFLLILWSTFGWCWGLQPGLEYQYRYNGRVASGITDVRHQFSAAGFQADVIVQVASDHSAVVKFSNVEVGDFHGDFTCDIRTPLPIEYHHLEVEVELLEKPFRITVNGSQVIEFLEVPSGEPTWITNIRKGFVNIFRIRPFGINHPSVHPNFGIREDTMNGYCTNWYNVIKLPQEDAAKENHEMELIIQEDAQRKGSSGSLDDTLWRVRRTLDFDDCEYLVTMKGHVNHHTEDLLSRSSVGTYLIRGDVNNMRVEKAVIEGSISLFTQDDHDEHLDTFTNQTIELKVVRPIEQHLAIDFEIHQFHSWHYEVDHTIADQKVEGVQPTLEQIVTGVELTEDIVTEAKRIINTGIQTLTDHMPRKATHTNHLVGEMSHVVDAISILNYQQLEEIYDLYQSFEEQLYILKQAMVAAGTEPSITCLLNKTAQEDSGYQETIYELFSQIPMTIKSPSYITKMMNVVMQLTWEDRHKEGKSIALVSFSQLVNKMCLSSERRSAYWDTTCKQDHICPTDAIINTYIPYLQQGLENEEIPMWHRLIYLEALSSLGTPHTISILQPYILGTKETHIAFRKNAIWSLSKPNMHSTATGKVFEMLMLVFENVGEHHEVRNVAFLVMATWEPSLSWWQSMAMATWHEPSNKVSNFVSHTIKTTAHMHGGVRLSKLTSRVEHLAKPAAPASLIHSVNYYLLEYLYSNELGHRLTFAWLATTGVDALIPSEIFFRLKMTTFLGITNELKVNLQHFGINELVLSVQEYMFEYMSEGPSKTAGQDLIDLVRGMHNELKENIGLEPNTEKREKFFLAKIQRLFRFIMTFDGKAFKTFDSNIFLAYAHRIFNRPHYYRYVDAFVAIPTELGLPFIAKHIGQNTWRLSYSEPRGQSAPLVGKGSTSLTFDASQVVSVEVKTLIPWSKKYAVGTGSENMISILLPFNIHYLYDFKNYELQLSLEPLTEDKVNLIDAHNLPYTVQSGAFPTILHYHNSERIAIKRTDDYLYTRKTQALPSDLGLWIESEWTGDIQFPFNLRSLYKGEFSVQIFTPTVKIWDYHLLYDPKASATKSVSTTLTYVSADKTPGAQPVVEVTQDASPIRQRIAKLQDLVVPATGGHVRSISIDFNLQGKKYDAVLTWVTGIISSKSSTKFQFSWIKDIPDESHATCINVQLLKPHILPLVSVEDLLNTDFHATVKADVHDGVNCEEPPVLEIQGILDVSQEQLNIVRKNLTEEHCGSASDFLPIDLITSPIYDHVQFKAHWTEGFHVQLQKLTYFAYDMIRGVMFPDVLYDYTVRNANHNVEIDATKSLRTHHWTIHTTKPTEVSIIEDFETPYLFDVVASPAHIKETLLYDFLLGRQHQACVIEHHKIRTSDGLEIPYKPDECWHVVAMDTTGNNYGSVETRLHDGQWEVRILYPSVGLRLEMTKTTFKVNGEDYNEENDMFNVVFLDDGVILTLEDFLTDLFVKITDKVYYLEDQMFRSWAGGLCGNLDGEIHAEMVGPKGCVYTDTELFVNSWATPAEGCSGPTYEATKAPVEAYQGACPHKTYVPTGVSYPNMLDDSMDWEYQERTEGIFKCKALIPTPKCKPGFIAIHTKSQPIKYDCEVTEETGPHGHECYPHEYTTTYPGNCVHE